MDDAELIPEDSITKQSDEGSFEQDDDFIVETIQHGDEELFEDDVFESEGVNDAPASLINSSRIIDSLQDRSIATRQDAQDSSCSVAAYTYCRAEAGVSLASDGSSLVSCVLIAVGSVDEHLRFYTLTGKNFLSLINVCSDFTDSVVSVGFSFDGKYVAAGSYDCSVVIYEIAISNEGLPSVTLLRRLEGPSLDVEWMAWHPKGYALLAGSKDATAWMWMATTGHVMNIFSGHAGPVACGAFAHNGRLVVTGGADGSVIVWNPKTAERIETFGGRGDTAHKHLVDAEPITCIATHQSLPVVAAGSEDKTIRLINVETGKLLGVLSGHQDTVESVAFYDNKGFGDDSSVLLASGGLDGVIHLWDCSRLQSRLCFKHTDLIDAQEGENGPPIVGGVTKLTWVILDNDPSRHLLVSTGTDCTLRLWNVWTQQCVDVLPGHKDSVLDMVCIPSERRFVSCSDDGSVKLWQL